LTRGWRLPGSLVTTYGFIGGTVWLNVAAADGWTDAVAHALAPVSYAVLVEFLAHLLRLHLRLAQPARPRPGLRRLSWLTWLTSPIVTNRVWLHLARTDGQDPVAARALVQQVVRMASRLRTICPSPPLLGWSPLGSARAARSAVLQTIRDGLLSAGELAAQLPDDGSRLTPGALLALVDRAALRTALPTTNRITDRTASRTATADPVHRRAPDPERTSAPPAVHPARTATAPADPAPAAPATGAAGRAGRTDAELVAALHQHGGPMSQREVMRILGVGTPKAKRLVQLAGWSEPDPAPTPTSARAAELNGHYAQVDARQLAIVHDGPIQLIVEPTTEPTPKNGAEDNDPNESNESNESNELEARTTR
jgi:hypothetical protein